MTSRMKRAQHLTRPTLLILMTTLLLALTTASANDILFGAYTYGGIHQGIQPIETLERDLGRQLDIVHWYAPWDDGWNARGAALLGDRTPLISWENNHVTTASIAAGQHDTYIREWAAGARQHPTDVYVRLFPEMNGDWTPWNGNAADLKAAWRRIVNLFRLEGAHNVKFVFSPNITDEPRADWNRMENYYPGDEYVDVLALDGFNRGDTLTHRWRTFQDTFQAPYERITRLNPTAPVWIAETGSTDTGGSKAQWVTDMFRALENRLLPNLEAVVWFNEDKEYDWRIDSSPAALQAFRAHLDPTLALNAPQ